MSALEADSFLTTIHGHFEVSIHSLCQCICTSRSWGFEGSVSVQVKDTFDVDDSRRSYFSSLFPLNPGGIVPAGPTLADLRLDEDPKRGPRSTDKIFHRKAQLALAA